MPWVKADLALAPGEAKRLDIALTLGATIAGKVVDENGAPVAARGAPSCAAARTRSRASAG